ncbi:MAG: 23S rRNA (adenine(2503)-C(2))-methyltransferase RlmN [Candidatus Omnitrophica bacterium]|nr:23S rRNA (adenine(2503)-C(2))-methyltransferase RlmN [Candidatus Omnitrophota bacterium]
MAEKKEDIKDLSLDELKSRIRSLNEPPYRAEQVFEWIYKKGARSFGSMTDLPAKLRDYFTNKFFITGPEIIKKQVSRSDGTRKYLFKLNDGETVEGVLIPAKDRQTICLSSQAGCAFGCYFCASGLLGFKRDLRCGEILDQALAIQDDIGEAKAPAGSKGPAGSKRITNVVMMGTGEPLTNYDNVIKAIGIMNSPQGLGIGARKITVSTAGYIPGMKRYMQEKGQFELSVSLHAADDIKRSRLMPINKKYPLSELIAVCREYTKEKGRIITFEYILIKDVNSSPTDAQNLAKLLKGLNCKVNLIPFNAVPDFKFAPPSNKDVENFQEILEKAGISSTIRSQRGADIDAACGQLRLREAEEEKC